MKKTYIAFAVLAMAALTGCQTTEFQDVPYVPEKGEIVFRLANGGKATKASDAMVKGAVMDLGSTDGNKFVLEESITYLDQIAYSPETKGTPAYTENFADLYKNFKAAAFKTTNNAFEAAAFDDGVFEKVSGVEIDIWKRKYANLDESLPLYFFLRAPYDKESTSAGVGKVSGLEYDTTNGSISFSYTSPATATEQEDLLFTSRKLEEGEYKAFQNKNEGIPVLFHHALTGVKFAIAADVMAQVSITKVEFTGLADGGKCVVTPRQELTTGYKDNKTGDYSSDDVSIWDTDSLTYGGTTFSQEFSGVVSYESAGTGVAHFGDSFYLAGNKNNLNDANASLTFWFIPQPMTDNVKLKIYYTAYGKEDNWTIDFGKTIKDRTTAWYAGELHTYTIRIDDVNVKIEDEVTIQNSDNEYKGSYKDNVVITNTGNTDTYIRAAIIGQWLNSEGNPVFGFTDFTAHTPEEQYVLVDSWYQDQFSASGQHKHGAFKDLVGYKNDTESGTPGTTVFTSDWWIKGGDGYYYFKYVVPAGKAVPAQDSDTKYIVVSSSGTSELTVGAPLFDSYTIKDAPDARVAGKVEEIFFELEIATQAVSAKKTDGSYYTLAEAWAKAGITVTE